jgi:hypothetical protein
MSYFSEATEVEHFIGGIFTECMDDADLGPKFAATGVILKLNFSEPDSLVLVDCPNRKVYRGDDVEAAPDPTVEMFMTSDIGHEYWLGKRNVSVCLAKGDMRAKGPVPQILKLVPLTRHVFPRYEEMIVESGRLELNPV